ncbi:hypothetical protein [Peribacillus frigoritolerans]|uniref:hypothetical protein n=1 Tax=Peribacillus frigoritolerans TaxID=450367 RepID=UPI0020794E2A|nr:hypothetical protein [Peribacillus frigoritolerans]USK76639.1 hypothetical protein LIT31_08865 [Peribacillus frigoritolerans]
MERIQQFNVNFKDEETPFFQVDTNHRIRFGMDEISGSLLTTILKDIFNTNEKIDTSFIIGNITNNKRHHEKNGIGKSIKINNWEEVIVKDEEMDAEIIYATVKGINNSDVYNYCKKVHQGHREAYIVFYNDRFLIYVNNDVLDIISNDSNLIRELKVKYEKHLNEYYA